MSDHHPTCPRCGDICEPRQERCDCGARLYMTVGAGRARRSVPPPRPVNVAAVPVDAGSLEEWWAQRFTAAELRYLGAGL